MWCCFQIGLAIAVRYALTRRAFAITPNGPELLLLDYPSHQRRLVPLLAKALVSHFETLVFCASLHVLF